MTARFVLSDAAAWDILEQASWYQEKHGTKLSQRWEQAVTSTFLRITDNASTGAPCRFKSPELRGIRRMNVRGFPNHLVFYRVFQNELTILRVAHGARDLENLF